MGDYLPSTCKTLATVPFGRTISVRQLPFAVLFDNLFWNRRMKGYYAKERSNLHIVKDLQYINFNGKNWYRAFSLTRPASIQIYWNKRKYLQKKRVLLPLDWFGTSTWPSFDCFWNTNMAAVTSCGNFLSIDLFCLYGGPRGICPFFLLINYAYICTGIRRNLKETVLWSIITWPTPGKQNI